MSIMSEPCTLYLIQSSELTALLNLHPCVQTFAAWTHHKHQVDKNNTLFCFSATRLVVWLDSVFRRLHVSICTSCVNYLKWHKHHESFPFCMALHVSTSFLQSIHAVSPSALLPLSTSGPPVTGHLPPGLLFLLLLPRPPCCLFDYPHLCSSHYALPKVRGCLAVRRHLFLVDGWLHS